MGKDLEIEKVRLLVQGDKAEHTYISSPSTNPIEIKFKSTKSKNKSSQIRQRHTQTINPDEFLEDEKYVLY